MRRAVLNPLASLFQMIPLDSFVGQSADGKMVPIIPGGNSIPLSFSNRKEYVERAVEYRLHELDRQVGEWPPVPPSGSCCRRWGGRPCCSAVCPRVAAPTLFQVAAVREGMSWIVPVPLLSLLTAKQLEQMVCGMPEICCEVLKKVVRYREVDEQHSLVQWFWQTLDEFSNEERVLFMRFVSGRSRLPANTADISQRFQIMKVDRVSAAAVLAVLVGGVSPWFVSFGSRTTASRLRKPASSSCACRPTPARRSWPSGCVTPSTTAAPSTWTTTCCPVTWTTPRAPTPTTDA